VRRKQQHKSKVAHFSLSAYNRVYDLSSRSAWRRIPNCRLSSAVEGFSFGSPLPGTKAYAGTSLVWRWTTSWSSTFQKKSLPAAMQINDHVSLGGKDMS
jgi:hypothetical protein